MSDLLLSTKDVAARLGVSRPFARHLMTTNQLAHIVLPGTSKTRRHRRVSEAQLLEFLSRHANERC